MNKQENRPLLKDGERLDDLQRNGYQIIQNGNRFCFGMDAVLLAAFTQVKKRDRVLDLGTGTGVIPLLLRGRTPGRDFTGLEISETSADMARRSVLYNHLEEDIKIVSGDIRQADTLFAPGSFDVITSNPPYMIGGHGLVNPDAETAAARHEILCTFDDVARAAAVLLKEHGHFCLVHRPFRMAEILCTLCAHRLEPKRIRLVYPYADQKPNMMLIEAVKGGRPRTDMEKPLVIYERRGVYTEEVRQLYSMQENYSGAAATD